MKTLSCEDMGVKGCPFVAKGETDKEVMDMLKEHAMTAHPEKMEEMKGKEEEMGKMMMAHIKG